MNLNIDKIKKNISIHEKSNMRFVHVPYKSDSFVVHLLEIDIPNMNETQISETVEAISILPLDEKKDYLSGMIDCVDSAYRGKGENCGIDNENVLKVLRSFLEEIRILKNENTKLRNSFITKGLNK